MWQPRHAEKRIIIVGGGVSGLSIAARLAQAGFSVTVLESSHLGYEASTRNQGWLLSGAWFAPEHPALAKMCYQSLRHTVEFAPECLEPDCGSMVYLMQDDNTDPSQWTSAWSDAGIPFSRLTSDEIFSRFPDMAISRARDAYELPDRAIRWHLLLRRLAQVAEAAGTEIRTGVTVTRLFQEGDYVHGVETSHGERLHARLVILAGNAKGGFLYPGFAAEAVGSQHDVALVALKTHLVAARPEISRWPLCVVDAGGFNHIPHPPASVFGSNRWLHVRDAGDERIFHSEVARIWQGVRSLFPDFHVEDHRTTEWAGTTVQAMHVGQIKPGRLPLPTAVDHAREHPPVENLVSVFPGRASLWPYLAEETHGIVQKKLDSAGLKISTPPWGQLAAAPETPRSTERQSRSAPPVESRRETARRED
jgi:glycine/D-amino acid oxidase-like deaminating enzyme